MALSDKNIVITPNRSQSADPVIAFSGASASVGPQTINLRVYPDSNGTLSFEGSAGQLFSITNDLSGTIFSINDVSGIPSLEIQDNGAVKIAQYSGNLLIGTATDEGSKLQVNGTAYINTIKQVQTTVTPAATTTINLTTSNNFYITLNQNITFAFSNASSNIGASGYILLKQDATGGRTITLPAVCKTPGARALVQSTGANQLSLLSYYVVASDTIIVNYIGNFG